jgi:hypothetical protein
VDGEAFQKPIADEAARNVEVDLAVLVADASFDLRVAWIFHTFLIFSLTPRLQPSGHGTIGGENCLNSLTTQAKAVETAGRFACHRTTGLKPRC